MVSDEPWLLRTISLQTGTRTQAFRDAVRSRDRQCAISGEEVPSYGGEPFYMGFEAAHIFPLAHEGHWIDNNYDRWITIPPEKGGVINSVQNGLLLRGDIYQLFDSYNLSINPDVYMPYIFCKHIVANNYLRIITRLCSLSLIRRVLSAGVLAKNFLMTVDDLLISFYVGTSGRLS
jgi:hypothetical protein